MGEEHAVEKTGDGNFFMNTWCGKAVTKDVLVTMSDRK
jgi:hypothetical protein